MLPPCSNPVQRLATQRHSAPCHSVTHHVWAPPFVQVKADLAIEVAATIKRRELTQEQAAKLMGVDQARVSRIVRGHLSRYTIDSLLRSLTRLSRNVTIVVDTQDADHQGSVPVRAG